MNDVHTHVHIIETTSVPSNVYPYIENFEQLENIFSFDNTALTIKFISLHLLIMLTANIFRSFWMQPVHGWLAELAELAGARETKR